MNRFNSLTKPLMWFMALLMVAFVAGCGGGNSSSTPVPSFSNSAKAINTFSLAWTTRTPGGTATGTIDQTLKTITVPVPHRANITDLFATFTTSPGVIVTVGSVTQVSGLTPNGYTNPVSYNVTAADGTWATYTVIVNRDQTVTSLAVDPLTATTPKGATFQFAANATYLDDSIDDVTATASWTSAASGVASVGSFDTAGTTGLATGLAVGTSDITATFSGKTATAALTVDNAALVSLAITPVSGVVAVGNTKQFVATGTYTDGSHPLVTATASWTSAASGVASVGSFDTTGTPGLATGVTASTTPVVITATIIDSVYGSVSGTADLLVTAPPGPNLRRTASFAVLSTGSSITATGTTAVTGDVGATSFTGGGTLNITAGTDYSAGTGQPFVDAQTDLPSVISDANNATLFPCGSSIAPNLSGIVLTPGVTCINADAAILNTGIVTLNGAGVYIIRTTGALTPGASSSVAFGGTATNANTTVFWVVGAADIGSPSTWMGTILTGGAVVLGDTDTLVKGRVLTTAAVTLSNNSIEKP